MKPVSLLFILLSGALLSFSPPEPPRIIPLAKSIPVVDGSAGDECWKTIPWQKLDQLWVGKPATSTDFSGRYKVAWGGDRLYVLAEITDDTLVDTHPDPLQKWWDDDCLEIFVDPDGSGGNHQYNHNAFAYHVALDGNVVDMGLDSAGILLNSHVKSAHTQNGKTTTWECEVCLFPSYFNEKSPNLAQPIHLKPGTTLGFALAYCDNDHSPERENFYGSEVVESKEKNLGWITADVFRKVRLGQ